MVVLGINYLDFLDGNGVVIDLDLLFVLTGFSAGDEVHATDGWVAYVDKITYLSWIGSRTMQS